MNPDGSNQREVTAELAPVSGYDISGDGTTIAYGAGGVVKKMSHRAATTCTTLTPGGNFEYAPTFTPGRHGRRGGSARRQRRTDLGYWRYPLVSGTDSGRSPRTGRRSSAARRSAATADRQTGRSAVGAARGVQPGRLDDARRSRLGQRGQIVDLTGATAPSKLGIAGQLTPGVGPVRRRVLPGSDQPTTAPPGPTGGSPPAGSVTSVGPAARDDTSSPADVGRRSRPASARPATVRATWPTRPSAGGPDAPDGRSDAISEASPSFSPDGSHHRLRPGRRANSDGFGRHLDRQDGRHRAWPTCRHRRRLPSSGCPSRAQRRARAKRPGSPGPNAALGRPECIIAGLSAV